MSENDKRSVTEWNNLRLSLLWAYEHEVPPQARESAMRPYYSVWLIRSGMATVKQSGYKEVSVRPGQLMCLSPYCSRTQFFAPETHILSVAVIAEWPDGTPLFRQVKPLLKSGEDVEALESSAMKLAHCMADVGGKQLKEQLQCELLSIDSYLKLRSLFNEWIELWISFMTTNEIAIQLPGQYDERVNKSIAHLVTMNYSGCVPYDTLQKLTGLSRSRLDVLFRQETNYTLKQYIERVYLSRGIEMLTGTDQTIKEIAWKLGFANDAHFSVWFKRKMGFPPQQFRLTLS